jgi:hypothetical protein
VIGSTTVERKLMLCLDDNKALSLETEKSVD